MLFFVLSFRGAFCDEESMRFFASRFFDSLRMTRGLREGTEALPYNVVCNFVRRGGVPSPPVWQADEKRFHLIHRKRSPCLVFDSVGDKRLPPASIAPQGEGFAPTRARRVFCGSLIILLQMYKQLQAERFGFFFLKQQSLHCCLHC